MTNLFKRVWDWIKAKLGRKHDPVPEPPQVGGFSHIAFPIVRRVYPSLIASQFVNIQPMSTPAGGIFTLDYTYGDAAVMYFYRRTTVDSGVDLGYVIAHCPSYSDIDHETSGRWTFSSMRVKR